jgi:hypothetical protein
MVNEMLVYSGGYGTNHTNTKGLAEGASSRILKTGIAVSVNRDESNVRDITVAVNRMSMVCDSCQLVHLVVSEMVWF